MKRNLWFLFCFPSLVSNPSSFLVIRLSSSPALFLLRLKIKSEIFLRTPIMERKDFEQNEICMTDSKPGKKNIHYQKSARTRQFYLSTSSFRVPWIIRARIRKERKLSLSLAPSILTRSIWTLFSHCCDNGCSWNLSSLKIETRVAPIFFFINRAYQICSIWV